jgi:hypothetical protein
MNKTIKNRNSKGELHGYQEWYHEDNGLWLIVRGVSKNNKEIGYIEQHGHDKSYGRKETSYFIK